MAYKPVYIEFGALASEMNFATMTRVEPMYYVLQSIWTTMRQALQIHASAISAHD